MRPGLAAVMDCMMWLRGTVPLGWRGRLLWGVYDTYPTEPLPVDVLVDYYSLLQ